MLAVSDVTLLPCQSDILCLYNLSYSHLFLTKVVPLQNCVSYGFHLLPSIMDGLISHKCIHLHEIDRADLFRAYEIPKTSFEGSPGHLAGNFTC